jgi:hypothetical protein
MDPLILAFVAGGAAIGAVVYLAMTARRLGDRITQLEGALEDEKKSRGPLIERLDGAQATQAKLAVENEELRRRAWPSNLNLDQRAWLSNVSTLQELAAQDNLDALMKLSPEAVQRVVQKIAPHLFDRTAGGPK